MKIEAVEELALPDVKRIRVGRFRDERGYFMEQWKQSDFQTDPRLAFLRSVAFVQGNESFSRAGTVRGWHFQWNPPQSKLVRVLSGQLIDFAVDIRPGSPTLRKVVGCTLQADVEARTMEWVWIPAGFAHCVLFPADSTIEYLCNAEWNPQGEGCICPTSDELDWSLCDPVLVDTFAEIVRTSELISDKDRQGMTFADWLGHPENVAFSAEFL